MLEGHFIPSKQGKLFVSQFGKSNSDAAILCLPAITEELNLSRAVVAKQAQNFAQHGLPCFVLDYFGTGDSEGELEQADCDLWLENVLTAGEWLKQQGISKIILWGVRFGALLILAHQKKLHQALPINKQLLWKPVTNGKQFARQLLRIKQAASIIHSSAKNTDWRQRILAGHNTEIAGYNITSRMLTSLEMLQIDDDMRPASPIIWIELATNELSPVTKNLCAKWPQGSVSVHCFESPPFWQVPDVFSLPELYELTRALISSPEPA
ncbi:hypothetical protein [Thalassotalea sp. ND16A]|uniref:hypothetical protein n=1 Tax=Thalassotalea sp. ND16A TaxID=1535422 RepID=UPI00051A68E8|nr:hypothetical protein [Thalassotalea sp. ND16A]KGJ95947.1 hypothetical protein ND16A_1126 [Thalassotalea sp. ND16A]